MILSDVGRREDAERVAEKIIAALVEPFEIGSDRRSVEIGVSIGIAVYPSEGQDANVLVKAADAAMYFVKKARTTS